MTRRSAVWCVAATLILSGCTATPESVTPDSPEAATSSTQLAAQREVTIAAAQPVAGPVFDNPNVAAIAAAMNFDPALANPRVTRIVGIYADEQMVDLRVQVADDEFCRWFGVIGHVRDGRLEWRGGGSPAAVDPDADPSQCDNG